MAFEAEANEIEPCHYRRAMFVCLFVCLFGVKLVWASSALFINHSTSSKDSSSCVSNSS
jgi:hypothetical protein